VERFARLSTRRRCSTCCGARHGTWIAGLGQRDGFGIVSIPNALATAALPPDRASRTTTSTRSARVRCSRRPAGFDDVVEAVDAHRRRIDENEDRAISTASGFGAPCRAREVSAAGDAAVRIWARARRASERESCRAAANLRGPLIQGTSKGFVAYVEVLLTGRTTTASYVLSVTASRR